MNSNASYIISEVLDYLKINAKELSERIGLNTPQGIYDMQHGKTKYISQSMADKIISVFPEFNRYWFFTGEGNMLNLNSGIGNNSEIIQKETKIIRYYELDASAGSIEMFNPGSNIPFSEMVIPGYGDCEIGLNAWGDSMEPLIRNGDIILCKEWQESFIQYGQIYLIITNRDNRMIKYLKQGSTKEMVSCVSHNDFFQPFEIPLSDILKLYKVKGHIGRNEL